jgi:DNA-binding IclR family transcriptional regulator
MPHVAQLYVNDARRVLEAVNETASMTGQELYTLEFIRELTGLGAKRVQRAVDLLVQHQYVTQSPTGRVRVRW